MGFEYRDGRIARPISDQVDQCASGTVVIGQEGYRVYSQVPGAICGYLRQDDGSGCKTRLGGTERRILCFIAFFAKDSGGRRAFIGGELGALPQRPAGFFEAPDRDWWMLIADLKCSFSRNQETVKMRTIKMVSTI